MKLMMHAAGSQKHANGACKRDKVNIWLPVTRIYITLLPSWAQKNVQTLKFMTNITPPTEHLDITMIFNLVLHMSSSEVFGTWCYHPEW